MINIRIIIFFFILLLFIIYTYRVENFANNIFDQIGNKLVFEKNSPYQKIEVYDFTDNKYGINRCLILDKEIQLCKSHEKEYHEFITHLPIYYIQNLERVLIIGGGDCMVLREVMKYNTIKKVDMLELDQEVINVSKKYFGQSTFNKDNRVNILIGDAQNTIDQLDNNYYDLVILDLTEDGLNNSPLDSTNFFEKCKNKLKKDGILVKNGGNLENYIRLSNIFSKIDIFGIELKIFSIYKYNFIICSDTVRFRRSTIKNDILLNLNLSKYNYKNHKNYFFNKK
jgi:spermidine synthase